MKRLLKFSLLLLALGIGFSSQAQILDPVKWKFTVIQTKPDEATLVFTANIEPKWHVYSQFLAADGPIPTSFTFTKSSDYEVVGKVAEGKTIEEYDANFDMKLRYFEGKGVFKQKIKVKTAKDFKIKGTLNFMVCNDKQCLPPSDVDFEFNIKGNPAAKADKGQMLDPIKWVYTVVQTKSDEAALVIKANIDPKWHLYSQFTKDDAIRTTLTFTKSSDYETLGKITESNSIEKYEPVMGMKLRYFESKGVFEQKVKIKTGKDFKIKGNINFIACNEKQCLPPTDVEFEFNVKGNTGATANEPATATTDTTKNQTADSTTINGETKTAVAMPTLPETSKESSLWVIFLEGLLGGFAALIMPCIFPMLPLTVSYFTKKNHSRTKAFSTAAFYGLSIITLYVSLGLGVTIIFGSDALNDLASNGLFNFVFFIMLILFAFSFLGAFEITLPSWIVNASDRKSEQKGLVGIFFMAITLAVVSFSCTGPIIGTLLVDAASKGKLLGPAIGMFGFSLALSIPFALFAAFPSWLKTLPKSGGWLNSVKVVLGFLELALALKFLSNVDLAYHWRILDREVFLVLWIVIFFLLGMYLLGKLKFSHDSDVHYISITRLMLAIVSFSFSLYMVPGLWGAPLKAISAFSPPQHTQDFDLTAHHASTTAPASGETVSKKHADLFECPHGLNCFFDYDEALAYAKKVNKPLFIDFTGHSCVNCRKMEVSVWSDEEVLKRMNNDYVLLSLYVDDKTELAEGEKYTSTYSGKKIKTLGNKWSDLQASRFNTNSQPYYVLLDNDGKLLTQPHAFNLDINTYIKFLDGGKEAYQEKKAAVK